MVDSLPLDYLQKLFVTHKNIQKSDETARSATMNNKNVRRNFKF